MAIHNNDSPPWRVDDTTPVQTRLDILTDLATQGTFSPAVQNLAKTVRARAASQSDLATAAMIAVQNLLYHPDLPGEWFQGVSYTVAHGGDCEDLSAALQSVFMVLGIKSHLVWLDQKTKKYNHVSIEALINHQFLWAETTIPGAGLGEHPYDAVRRLGAGHAKLRNDLT